MTASWMVPKQMKQEKISSRFGLWALVVGFEPVTLLTMLS